MGATTAPHPFDQKAALYLGKSVAADSSTTPSVPSGTSSGARVSSCTGVGAGAGVTGRAGDAGLIAGRGAETGAGRDAAVGAAGCRAAWVEVTFCTG